MIIYINMIITSKIERVSVFSAPGTRQKKIHKAIAHIAPDTIYGSLGVNQITVVFRTGFGPYMPKV